MCYHSIQKGLIEIIYNHFFILNDTIKCIGLCINVSKGKSLIYTVGDRLINIIHSIHEPFVNQSSTVCTYIYI